MAASDPICPHCEQEAILDFENMGNGRKMWVCENCSKVLGVTSE